MILCGAGQGFQAETVSPPSPAASQHADQAGQLASARRQFQKAEQFLHEGATADALEAVRAGLKTSPKSVEGWNLLGLVYDQQKDYEQGVAALKRAVQLDPHSAKSRINLGNTYFALGYLDLSESELRVALQETPNDRDANYDLAMVLLARDQPQEAIPFLKRVRPADDSSRIALIQAYFQAHDPAQALALASTESQAAKSDVRLHFSLGILLAREKQYDAATHELEVADTLRPGTPEILYNLGEAYYRSKRYGKAEEALNRGLSLTPNSPETLYLLAEVYAAEQKDLQALDLLLEARKLDPKNTDVIFLLSRLTMGQGYYQDAIELLEEGLKLDPSRPDLRAALGESYFSSGKVDKAIEEFQKLIDLDPSASSYVFMGLCYRNLHKFEDAQKYFNEGLKKDPKNAACLFNLGFIECKQGNYAQAENLLEQALSTSPDYSDALYELAQVKMAEKKYAEAIPLLQKCATVATKKAPVYYSLAEAERHAHQLEAAQRNLKIFETLSKDESNAAYPFQNFLGALNERASLPPRQKAEVDLQELLNADAHNPNDPRNLYLLAETYLKLGRLADARQRIAQLDQASGKDVRTELGVGALLARFGLFSDAVQHFQSALAADPASDDAKYNLANAYFQMRNYPLALDAILKVSPEGQEDEAALDLMGDIYAHLGRTKEAAAVFEKAIEEYPDNDQCYLSLALTDLRAGDKAAARLALRRGLNRTPDSGEIIWGLGVLSVLEGDVKPAETYFTRALELMPEWRGSYQTLEMYYGWTGQEQKAREILREEAQVFKLSEISPEADARDRATHTLSAEAQQQFLQKALALADDIE